MKTDYSKTAYENYLNNILDKQGTPQLAVTKETYLQKPGSYMRRHDPIQFEVGYNEWIRETQNS